MNLKSEAPADLVTRAAEPLPPIDDPAFGRAIDRFADARVICLGEASHGTSEFYRARAALTRRLVEEHGFTIVAVEADWPDAAVIDRIVRGKPPTIGAEAPFTRFPTWMWRNAEFQGFVDWLTQHNRGKNEADRVSFHGLDLYNMNASIRAVIEYLEQTDPPAASEARKLYGCLKPWKEQPEIYGRIARSEGHARCEAGVVQMLRAILANEQSYAAEKPDSFLDAIQNARLVANAEAYYRAMYYGSAASWNLRDEHMADTLQVLLQHKGPQAKAVVWAHNSHVGDARHTDMGRSHGELNLGQLVRERYDGAACLIGLGTHTGTVAAADDWDEPMQIKAVNPSRSDSHERIMHDSGIDRFMLDLRGGVADEDLRTALSQERLERYIGVIYRPQTERWSHYSEASLAKEYDGFVWFDTTRAVTARTEEVSQAGPDETWPFGV
ncbi:erythromycin esterase family protein [Novosphingobium sp. 9U]|uniref:erythromycin esterase family protein n=1 Tax=Novosphingobium sp. 9U TaxID=2653158 RepID=UPI0012EF56EC|nr:erythromycin esterase family protein [Novosphingobium sp. 9U]VWX50656.1 Erythromycin esterase homolog [Novosphingobium sp. 9U]